MNRDLRVEADSLAVLFKCRSPAVSADFNSAIPWHVRCESLDQQASHVTIVLLLLLMSKRSVITESRDTVISWFRPHGGSNAIWLKIVIPLLHKHNKMDTVR